MLFKDIIGQKEVKQQLVDLVQHNRLSHALLFLGKEGSGALPLALAFAQYIVCDKISSRQPAPDSYRDNNQQSDSLFGEEPRTSNLEPQTLNDACGICPS